MMTLPALDIRMHPTLVGAVGVIHIDPADAGIGCGHHQGSIRRAT
jgi:hypothetical protein